MEKILWHRIYDRYIKLYSWDCYPNWAKNYIDRDVSPWSYSPMKRLGHFSINPEVKMRDYQNEALEHVKKYAWGLIEAATWSWKSLMCIGITNLYKSKTLIVCPSKKLVKEMVEKFKQFTDYEPWTYYSDKKDIRDITVTTTMSFVKDMTEWNQVLQWASVVIIDECDDKISDKFIKAISHYDCNILVGMTWTASRQDLSTDNLVLIYWPHIKVWDYQLLPNKITQHVYNWSQEEISMVDYSWWATIRESMIWNQKRFEAIKNKIIEVKKDSFLTLVLLDRNADVDQFSESFPGALVITGNTKIKDDEKGIEQLRKTWGLIIWSLKKMYRGVDIPEIDNVIIASPVRFENTVVQSIWRALRKAEWKWDVQINVINDSILKNQRYEQAKVCREIYNISPEVIYFPK